MTRTAGGFFAKAAVAVRKAAWEGERLRWRLFHPITLGTRVILLRETEVLLIRHTYRDGWFFPGGGVDKGESLETAAIREAYEEARAVVRALEIVGVYANFEGGKSDHVAVFQSREFYVEGFEPGNEIAERRWFGVDSLPWDMSAEGRERLQQLIRGG